VLEPHKRSVTTRGWQKRGEAEAAVEDARRRFAEQGRPLRHLA
jgi:hypothetical protein